MNTKKNNYSEFTIGESFYGKTMVNLEQFVRKGFLTFIISIGLAEQHITNLGKSNVQKYIVFTFKVY